MKHKTTLVDHLRSSAGVGRWTTAMHEAADLIEAQAAQIDVMQDALKEVQMVAESSVKTHGYDKHHVRNSDVAKRALATTHNDAIQTFAEKDRCKQRLSGFKNLIGDRRSIRSATACNRE